MRILGFNSYAIGSEVTEENGDMVTDSSPLNFNVAKVDTSIELAPVETAIFTDFIVTGDAEVLFENFKRKVSPPIDTRTTWRKVLLAKKGEGGALFDPGA